MTTAARNAVARRAQQAGNQPQQQSGGQQPTLVNYLQSMRGELARAVPAQISSERIARIALTSIRTVKHLDECTIESFAGALMTCAQLGLEPGGAAGEAYLIPFFNRQSGVYEVQLVIGYQGMVKLFWQSPMAKSLDAQIVYENDVFEYEYGLNPRLVHRPSLSNRGKPIAYYAVASTSTGGSAFVVMSPEDIEAVRKRAKTKNGGPWSTDYGPMAKKTCIRQLFKLLPKSVELSRAVAHDETVRTDASLDSIDAPPPYIAGEIEQAPAVDTGTGEVVDGELEPEGGWDAPAA